MKTLKLKLATEVIINITFLMVVAVSLIGLVVFKIVEQSIILERYQAGKSQALTLSRLAAPLWNDQTKPELERVAGLFLAPVPDEANREAERGSGAGRWSMQIPLIDLRAQYARIRASSAAR